MGQCKPRMFCYSCRSFWTWHLKGQFACLSKTVVHSLDLLFAQQFLSIWWTLIVCSSNLSNILTQSVKCLLREMLISLALVASACQPLFLNYAIEKSSNLWPHFRNQFWTQFRVQLWHLLLFFPYRVPNWAPGGCTILPYCSRTFWVYIAPFAFLSKRVVCSLALLIAVFLTSGEGTCASNPSKRFKESVKKICCVECWLFLLWWAWQPWFLKGTIEKSQICGQILGANLDPFWGPIWDKVKHSFLSIFPSASLLLVYVLLVLCSSLLFSSLQSFLFFSYCAKSKTSLQRDEKCVSSERIARDAVRELSAVLKAMQ